MFMRWELDYIWSGGLMGVWSQWCVSFPLKPTPLSRATGQEGRGRGGQTGGLNPAPSSYPKQQKTRHKGGGERQHQQYYDWLWWVSICSKKSGGVIDYRLLFSVFLCWSEGKGGVVIGEGWWGETKKITGDRKGCSNIKKNYKTIWLARGEEGEFPTFKNNEHKLTNGLRENLDKHVKKEKGDVEMKRQNASLMKNKEKTKRLN